MASATMARLAALIPRLARDYHVLTFDLPAGRWTRPMSCTAGQLHGIREHVVENMCAGRFTWSATDGRGGALRFTATYPRGVGAWCWPTSPAFCTAVPTASTSRRASICCPRIFPVNPSRSPTGRSRARQGRAPQYRPGTVIGNASMPKILSDGEDRRLALVWMISATHPARRGPDADHLGQAPDRAAARGTPAGQPARCPPGNVEDSACRCRTTPKLMPWCSATCARPRPRRHFARPTAAVGTRRAPPPRA